MRNVVYLTFSVYTADKNYSEGCYITARRWPAILFLSVWAALISAGFSRLIVYSNTPGEAAQARAAWPLDSVIKRDPDAATLVIFAHPRCPCSEATVGELERLMPHIKGKMTSSVVFFKPKNKTLAWAQGALWNKASAIPGVQTVLDEDGVEAAKFDARTSGQTFLYDSRGDLIFRGGITPERSHMGDNDGRSAILQFATTGKTTLSSTPVFGCAIRNPERASAKEPNE